MANLYMASPLFNAAERLHNLMVARELRKLGHNVILPQEEAEKFRDGEKFDLEKIAEDCKQACSDRSIICVANADGADADSGTCVEFGIAMSQTGFAVVYRTDFRTAPDQELGVNAMLRMRGARYVYCPCTFTTLDEADAYYRLLAMQIDRAVHIP